LREPSDTKSDQETELSSLSVRIAMEIRKEKSGRNLQEFLNSLNTQENSTRSQLMEMESLMVLDQLEVSLDMTKMALKDGTRDQVLVLI